MNSCFRDSWAWLRDVQVKKCLSYLACTSLTLSLQTEVWSPAMKTHWGLCWGKPVPGLLPRTRGQCPGTPSSSLTPRPSQRRSCSRAWLRRSKDHLATNKDVGGVFMQKKVHQHIIDDSILLKFRTTWVTNNRQIMAISYNGKICTH